MKNSYFSISLMIIFLNLDLVFSQSGWFWLNPQPQGNSILSVKFINENTAFAVGYSGTILKSTNSGNSWYFVKSNTNVGLGSICFINNLTGYIGGELLLKTTDGGENWFQVSTQNGKIYFADENTGFAAGSIPWPPPTYSAGFIAKTTNGGLSWTSISIPIAFRFNSIEFRNDIGFVCGEGFDGAIIFRTTNLGNNWVYTPTGIVAETQSVSILNDNDVIAVGYSSSRGKILRTTNLGNNWVVVDSTIQPFIYGSHFINANTGFIAGLHGVVLNTTNSGYNWNIYNTGFSSYFYDITFNTSGQGIVCGAFGITYLTGNYGTSWTSPFTRFTEDKLVKLNFLNRDTGYVLAERSKIYKTTNGGINWISNTIDTAYTNLGLNFININTGFVVGRNGAIFKTSNGSSNWSNKSMNNGVFFNDVYFVNENTGYIAGSYDNNYKTIDGGNNWSIFHVGYSSLMLDINFININTGFICGSERSIYRTSDEGNSWIRTNYLSSTINIHSIVFPNALTGYAACDGGKILRSTNGGLNWFEQSLGTTRNFYSVSFCNSYSGYVAGIFGNIYKTIDGGSNWVLQNSTTGSDLYAIQAFDSVTAIVAGNYGNILRTTTGGQYIGINTIQSSLPRIFLLHQNFPNPFNPNTKIRFEIAKPGFIQLFVYDVLGRTLFSLVNQYLATGIYETEWDATNYPSSIYFYRLIANDYMGTKKMVLIK